MEKINFSDYGLVIQPNRTMATSNYDVDSLVELQKSTKLEYGFCYNVTIKTNSISKATGLEYCEPSKKVQAVLMVIKELASKQKVIQSQNFYRVYEGVCIANNFGEWFGNTFKIANNYHLSFNDILYSIAWIQTFDSVLRNHLSFRFGKNNTWTLGFGDTFCPSIKIKILNLAQQDCLKKIAEKERKVHTELLAEGMTEKEIRKKMKDDYPCFASWRKNVMNGNLVEIEE